MLRILDMQNEECKPKKRLGRIFIFCSRKINIVIDICPIQIYNIFIGILKNRGTGDAFWPASAGAGGKVKNGYPLRNGGRPF